jgi:hypothetical protein
MSVNTKLEIWPDSPLAFDVTRRGTQAYCAHCEKETVKFFCKQCANYAYCSKLCRKKNLKNHSYVCKNDNPAAAFRDFAQSLTAGHKYLGTLLLADDTLSAGRRAVDPVELDKMKIPPLTKEQIAEYPQLPRADVEFYHRLLYIVLNHRLPDPMGGPSTDDDTLRRPNLVANASGMTVAHSLFSTVAFTFAGSRNLVTQLACLYSNLYDHHQELHRTSEVEEDSVRPRFRFLEFLPNVFRPRSVPSVLGPSDAFKKDEKYNTVAYLIHLTSVSDKYRDLALFLWRRNGQTVAIAPPPFMSTFSDWLHQSQEYLDHRDGYLQKDMDDATLHGRFVPDLLALSDASLDDLEREARFKQFFSTVPGEYQREKLRLEFPDGYADQSMPPSDEKEVKADPVPLPFPLYSITMCHLVLQ